MTYTVGHTKDCGYHLDQYESECTCGVGKMSEPDVIVCQGPPRCALTGDDAVQAAVEGCPWCERIYLMEDGSETVVKPGEA